MGFFALAGDYIVWHYSTALGDFFALGTNLVRFLWHFFSVPELTRTLFSPFARIRATRFSINDIEESLQNVTANIISRLVGFVLRTVVIAVGLGATLLMLILLVAAYAAWILLPFITGGLLIFALL